MNIDWCRRALMGVLLLVAAVGGALFAWSSLRSPLRLVEIPQDRSSDPNATFRFETDATNVACRRDDMRFRPCHRKVKFSGLSPGTHTFTLRGRHKGRTVVKSHRWIVTPAANADPPTPAPAARENAATLQRDPNGASPAARALVFADAFDGSALDVDAWRTYHSPGHDGYGLRRPSAVSLDGRGHLVITGKMQNGRIVSGGLAHRRDFTYGRVEFRVRTEVDPTGTMSGVVLTWPKEQWSPEYTENDMYETGPRANNRSVFDTFIHFGDTVSTQVFVTHDVDPSQWHTIAMEWYPNLLEVYVDGALGFSVSDPAMIPDILHHVVIQLDARADRRLERPVRMFVDYVRVYQ